MYQLFVKLQRIALFTNEEEMPDDEALNRRSFLFILVRSSSRLRARFRVILEASTKEPDSVPPADTRERFRVRTGEHSSPLETEESPRPKLFAFSEHRSCLFR